MKHLFLIRHAKASRAETSRGDRDRPLRPKGQRQMEAMAEPLQRLGAFAGEIHVSTATRARQTLMSLDVALPGHGLAERAHYHEALYTFDESSLRQWLTTLDSDTDRLTVIGHNPALLALARRLGCPPSKRLPTAALLHIALPITAWRDVENQQGELVHSLSPSTASHALFKRKMPAPPRLDGTGIRKRPVLLLWHQYRTIRTLEPGVIPGHDPEFLHQYRVNLRRSRAIAEALLDMAAVPGLTRALKGLKQCARATGELRDLHVCLEVLTHTPPTEATTALSPLTIWLRGLERKAHRKLHRQLQHPTYPQTMREWRDAITSKTLTKALSGLKVRQVDHVLHKRLSRHDALLASLTPDSPDTMLHTLRKQVKRIRYLAELSPKKCKHLLSRLKERQSLLGDFQDICAQIDRLDAFSTSAQGQQLPDASDQALRHWFTLLHKRKAQLQQAILVLTPLAGENPDRPTPR